MGLAELLRDINIVANSKAVDEKLLLLSKAKVHLEKYDIIANGTLDNLIRSALITNEMATSLMNDSTYAYDISSNLISMAQSMFSAVRFGDDGVHDEISLSEKDIRDILNKG
jgi:phosphate:Na+ symporter